VLYGPWIRFVPSLLFLSWPPQCSYVAHKKAQPINSIPTKPTASPMHVIFDNGTSAPTTPTATVASVASSPPPQVSSIGTPQSVISESTARPHVTDNNPTAGSSQVLEKSTPRLVSPTSLTIPDHHHSPPSISSPIPSLSQSYPQELDRERGVELLSPPSSGTSSPFTTFSPLAVPQVLSPFAVVQPLDHGPDPFSSEFDRWSVPHTPARGLSPSQHTASSSHYQSFPTSPLRPSPLDVNSDAHARTSHEELSQLSSPSPINFASPNALSPRSPHSNLSDLESMTDLDVMSEFGSDGSGGSWAEVSSPSGSAKRH
jgi:hypothetical protein